MKSNILITGATGLLGQTLLSIIANQKYNVTIASRKNPLLDLNYQWQKFDLSDNSSKVNLKGIHTIFHLASSTKKYNYAIDVKGTERLLHLAKQSDIQHFIYISVVGVDIIPIKYFKIKRAVEEVVQRSNIPYTILRSTQFFEFFELEIIKYLKLPVAVIPNKIVYQPIETLLVAKKLLEIQLNSPLNQIIEIGGSEMLTLGEASQIWLNHQTQKKYIWNIPIVLLGKFGKIMKNGGLATPSITPNSLNWENWLKKNRS